MIIDASDLLISIHDLFFLIVTTSSCLNRAYLGGHNFKNWVPALRRNLSSEIHNATVGEEEGGNLVLPVR